jgi:hypothetical protein
MYPMAYVFFSSNETEFIIMLFQLGCWVDCAGVGVQKRDHHHHPLLRSGPNHRVRPVSFHPPVALPRVPSRFGRRNAEGVMAHQQQAKMQPGDPPVAHSKNLSSEVELHGAPASLHCAHALAFDLPLTLFWHGRSQPAFLKSVVEKEPLATKETVKNTLDSLVTEGVGPLSLVIDAFFSCRNPISEAKGAEPLVECAGATDQRPPPNKPNHILRSPLNYPSRIHRNRNLRNGGEFQTNPRLAPGDSSPHQTP